jgi:threonine dehydrogenase-like Zn-dependent dehydrogenase
MVVRTARVVLDDAGSLRVSAVASGPRAVFVDSSPSDGGLWARSFESSKRVDGLAAAEFVATAMRAVAAARGAVDGPVQVIGTGLLGQLIAQQLTGGAAEAHPSAVIDATGTAASVQRALSLVESLGTVVLAAPVAAPVLPVTGYADVHKRGLTVVGVPWATEPVDVTEELVEFALAKLQQARDGEPAPAAPWYRVDI